MKGLHEEWRVESGEWRVESGEWRVESGEWRVELKVSPTDWNFRAGHSLPCVKGGGTALTSRDGGIAEPGVVDVPVSGNWVMEVHTHQPVTSPIIFCLAKQSLSLSSRQAPYPSPLSKLTGSLIPLPLLPTSTHLL